MRIKGVRPSRAWSLRTGAGCGHASVYFRSTGTLTLTLTVTLTLTLTLTLTITLTLNVGERCHERVRRLPQGSEEVVRAVERADQAFHGGHATTYWWAAYDRGG